MNIYAGQEPYPIGVRDLSISVNMSISKVISNIILSTEEVNWFLSDTLYVTSNVTVYEKSLPAHLVVSLSGIDLTAPCVKINFSL